MEKTPVKSEFGEILEPKPIVIIPDSFRSEHLVDISTLTSKREEDLKPTNCPQESNFSKDSELPTFNINDDLNRWTVLSSVVLPLEKTENTCHGSEQSVDTGDTCRSVERDMLVYSVKNEGTYTYGTQICELNEHTGQLAVIPNLTKNPPELKTGSDLPLSPLSLDDQLDHNNSCRNSEIKAYNVPTSTMDDKGLIHSVDQPLYEDQVITPSISSQTSMKETSEQSNDTLESQTLSAGLSSNEQFDHSSTGNPEVNTFSESTSIRDGKGEKHFKCDICNKAFTQSYTLIKHQRTHTGEKPYKCDVCDKEFTRSDILYAHQRIHTGEKPYACDICNKAFTHLGNHRTHRLTHYSEKPHKCDVCSKTFARPSYLRAHQHTHTKETPYKCDVCNKEFTQSHILSAHHRIHTGEKPYTCDICNKSFTHSSNLRSHKLTHNIEKPHKCDLCNKTFTRRSYLRVHQRTHTGEKPYKCGVCNKTFTRSSNLSAHQLTHTGAKPYKCDVCSKTFRQSSTLNTHQRIHTGERPFKCDVCNKAYTRLDGLRVHQRIHTGKKT